MSIFIRTVPNVMRHFGCDADNAQRYIDLRDEGYSTEQAALMAGLSDPPEPSLAMGAAPGMVDSAPCEAAKPVVSNEPNSHGKDGA